RTVYNPTHTAFPLSDAQSTTLTLNPTPSHVGPPFNYTDRYTFTFAGDCSGTIAAGETRTCTITADDRPTHGTFNVETDVINNNGGTAVASDWTISISGTNPVPASFADVGSPGRTAQLNSSPYRSSASRQTG